jgi:putative isomerase
MVQEYRAMAEVARRSGQGEPSLWEEKAKALATAIETHMWDPIDQCYFNLEVGRHVPGRVNQPVSWVLPLKVKSWTSLMPLWAQVASPERAKLMVELHLMNEARLLAPHGMRSLAKDEPAYEVKVSSNPSCWRGPIWVVNNYLVNQGLQHYGFETEARELAGRLQRMLVRDLDENGELHEYYDPETGEGLTHPGFLNWNTLAGVM